MLYHVTWLHIADKSPTIQMFAQQPDGNYNNNNMFSPIQARVCESLRPGVVFVWPRCILQCSHIQDAVRKMIHDYVQVITSFRFPWVLGFTSYFQVNCIMIEIQSEPNKSRLNSYTPPPSPTHTHLDSVSSRRFSISILREKGNIEGAMVIICFVLLKMPTDQFNWKISLQPLGYHRSYYDIEH